MRPTPLDLLQWQTNFRLRLDCYLLLKLQDFPAFSSNEYDTEL